MDLIESNSGWFVTRLKSNSNPMIVEELRGWRGAAISLTDRKLHDVLDDLHRDVIDVRVEVSFKRRRYQRSRSRATRTFRVVGIRNEETEEYHLYITNLPVSDYRALIELRDIRRAGRSNCCSRNSNRRSISTRFPRANRRWLKH